MEMFRGSVKFILAGKNHVGIDDIIHQVITLGRLFQGENRGKSKKDRV